MLLTFFKVRVRLGGIFFKAVFTGFKGVFRVFKVV